MRPEEWFKMIEQDKEKRMPLIIVNYLKMKQGKNILYSIHLIAFLIIC